MTTRKCRTLISLIVPGRVTGVRVSSVTNTSVTVEWDDGRTGTSLLTTRFVVHITNENTGETRRVNTDDSPAVIESLSPYSSYTIRVNLIFML